MTDLATAETVRVALALLRAQVPGQHPEVTETTVVVWHTALALYPAADVTGIALDWPGDRFPTKSEFVRAVADRRRAAADADAQRALEGVDTGARPCCDAGPGWQFVGDPTMWTVRPCPEGHEPPSRDPNRKAKAERDQRAETAPSAAHPRPVADGVIEAQHRLVGDG